MGKGWLNAILPRPGVTPSDELRDAIERGGSAALFLKRPPGVLDVAAGASGGRGLKEGDELVRTLIDLQRERKAPILLVPQVFVWTKQPDTRGTRRMDFLLGPREWPSPARTVGQFLSNYKHVALKAGEPLDLSEFLEGANGASDAVRVRRVTYAMLRRLERERRSVTGPAEKAPDRVRMEILRSPRLRKVISDLAGARACRSLRADRSRAEHAAPAPGHPGHGHDQGAGGRSSTASSIASTPASNTTRADIERVRAAAKEGTLVLLPSHKSHIDYLILSYVFNEENLQLPLIAAGDNLNFFPLGGIFRRGGAFFIRRSFKGDRLYAAVVDAYIRRLIRDGYPIELFLEGGRSRTGKLLAPKFGLLNMIVDAALGVSQRRAYFVPVSIGYERVVEAGSYERELSGGEKSKEDAAGLLKTTEVLRHRYGRINLQFGQILTLDEIREELGLQNRAVADTGQAPRARHPARQSRDGRDQPRRRRDAGRADRAGTAQSRQARHPARGAGRARVQASGRARQAGRTHLAGHRHRLRRAASGGHPRGHPDVRRRGDGRSAPARRARGDAQAQGPRRRGRDLHHHAGQAAHPRYLEELHRPLLRRAGAGGHRDAGATRTAGRRLHRARARAEPLEALQARVPLPRGCTLRRHLRGDPRRHEKGRRGRAHRRAASSPPVRAKAAGAASSGSTPTPPFCRASCRATASRRVERCRWSRAR